MAYIDNVTPEQFKDMCLAHGFANDAERAEYEGLRHKLSQNWRIREIEDGFDGDNKETSGGHEYRNCYVNPKIEGAFTSDAEVDRYWVLLDKAGWEDAAQAPSEH